MQELNSGEFQTTVHKLKAVIIEEKLECDATSLIPSAPPPPTLALASLLTVNDTMRNISNVDRTDADSEVIHEGPLWASLENKGTTNWKEGIRPGETDTERVNLEGG